MSISPEELDRIFDWQLLDDEFPVVYRKFTTDEIPDYTIQLNNYSQNIPLRVYASSSTFMSVTSKENNIALTTSSFVELLPLSDMEVKVVFNTSAIDSSINDSISLAFVVQALEQPISSGGSGSGAPPTGSSSGTIPTGSTSGTPPTGSSSGTPPIGDQGSTGSEGDLTDRAV